MNSLLHFLTVQHDLRYVLLSLAIAAATSVVTFTVHAHLLVRSSGRHGIWLLLTALCAGVGIWASQVIMALSVAVPLIGVRPLFAALSLVVALGASWGGIAVSARPERLAAAAGGAIIGFGMAAGFIIGSAGLDFAGAKVWAVPPAVAGALLGIVLSAASTFAFREYLGHQALIAGTALLTTGMAFTLLTAIRALTVLPDPDLPPAEELINSPLLAVSVAGVAASVLTAGYIAALLDGRAMRAIFSRLDELIDTVTDGIVIADRGEIVSVNLRALELTGRKQHDLVGKQVFGDLLGSERRNGSPAAILRFESMLVTASGKTFPVKVVRRPLHALARASEVYAIHDMRAEIEAAERIAFLSGELKQCQQDLRRRNFLLEGVLDNMSQGLCMFDADQRVVLSNMRYAAIYGLPPEMIRPGVHLRDIVQKRIDKGLYAGASPKAYLEERLAPIEKAGETMQELSDGRQILIKRRPMPGGGWITTHEDVTESRRMEAENKHLADHDALTDLPNRELLRKLLDEALAGASRTKRRFITLILDLDHFREVNDSLGHAMGDAVLKAVAERLRSYTRKTTILGRCGDDEFAIVESVDQPGRDAAALAARIQEQLRKPLKLDGKEVLIDSTIGIAISPGDGADAGALLKSADLALYRAKKEKRGTYRFYEAQMDRQLNERLALEHDLSEAVTNEQFTLHYQPLVSLARNEISGFEALLRWQHPVRGQVPPASFLPAAEAAGLMPAIEEWTLRQACAEAALWPDPLKVAVNISAARFRSPGFVQSVLAALASTGLNAQRLEFEISEAVIQADPEQAQTTLRQLADLGVRIALDDFGCGFASLNYLRRFPIQRVKIDRQFMGNLTQNGDQHIILRTLARLGAGFGVDTTAEGVETQEQFEIVRAEGCTEMQGYYISPPRTAEEIRSLFLAKGKSAVA